jgi:hypothetical protein
VLEDWPPFHTGISPWLLLLVLVVIIVGGVKLVKLLWAMFS